MSGDCFQSHPPAHPLYNYKFLYTVCKAPAKAQLRATDFSQLLYRQYTPVKSQNVLKPKREHCQRCQSAVSLPSTSAGLVPPTFFGAPLGHTNSLKIAPARALCAKVRARAPLNAKSRTFGGPRVPQGAKMEPKWRQMDTQNAPKIDASQEKCRKWFGPIIYHIFSVSAPSENLTFSHLGASKMQVFSAWCLGCRLGAAK